MPTASYVMSTTTAKAALFFAGHEMMLLDTSLAASVERSYATLAGRDSTALNQSVFQDVMKNTASVINQESASVVWALAGVIVMTASVTQAAFMAPANSLGSVTARRGGVGFSATRI